MEITFDIRTISMMLGITHLIQLIVFSLQYRINRSVKGIGWWVMWSIAEVLGFTFILFRDFESIQTAVIIIYNLLIMAGIMFIYFGIRRLFNKSLNLKTVLPAYAIYVCFLLFFLVIKPDYWFRSAVTNLFYVFFSLLTAHTLLFDRPRSIRSSATFNAVICIIHAGVFIYRSAIFFTKSPEPDMFVHTFFNYLPFIDALMVSLFWTFGFIIMVNHQLNVEISEARTQLQQIFTTSPDAVIITRLTDGKVVDINEGYTTITGYTREEISGRTTVEINIWKDINDRQNVVKILQARGHCENYEAVFVRKDRVEITGLMSAKIIMLNEVPHIISISRDISERKKMEESIRESNAYLENLINFANAPIIVWDSGSRIIRFNHAFEFLTGMKESEVRGRSLELLFPPDRAENSMALIRKTLTGERWESVEIVIRHRDGSLRTVLWNSATIFKTDGVTPLATIAQGQDITLRKMAELELTLKNAELQELITEKDKFFSILAHDLRSPFNSLLGFTQLLEEEAGELGGEDIEKIAGTIRKSALTLYRLLDDLLEWSRIQRGNITFHPEPIDLKTFIPEAIGVIYEPAEKKSIKLVVDIPANLTVTADGNMLSTVLRNLTYNAVKFTNRDGVITTFAAPADDGYVEITVADNGIGMPPEILNNLFTFSKNTSRNGTSGETSTGLGLIICKEFVEKQGGHIHVESEEGMGSRVMVRIPGNGS